MSDVLVLNSCGNPLSLMPLSIVTWQVAIRLLTLDKVKSVKDYDDWVVRSPSVTLNVPSIVICTEYIRWNRRVKYSRGNVLMRDGYRCQLQTTYKCKQNNGKGHKIGELTLDHVVPRSHGGKTSWANVTTACSECNSKKGSDITVIPRTAPTKPSYYELIAKRHKLPITIRDLEWKDYLAWNDDLIFFHPRQGKTIKLTDYLK